MTEHDVDCHLALLWFRITHQQIRRAPFLSVLRPFFIYYHLDSTRERVNRPGRFAIDSMGAHWHCPESARLVPMRSSINLNLSRCVCCHFKLDPFSVNNGSSCRLRPSRRSINYSTTNRAVDLLERHIYALASAALPTGVHLVSMDVRLARRDLTPDQPECHPSLKIS